MRSGRRGAEERRRGGTGTDTVTVAVTDTGTGTGPSPGWPGNAFTPSPLHLIHRVGGGASSLPSVKGTRMVVPSSSSMTRW